MAKRIPLNQLISNAAQMESQRAATSIASGNVRGAAEAGARLADINARLAEIVGGNQAKPKQGNLEKVLNTVATVTGANFFGNVLNDAMAAQQKSSWGQEEIRRQTAAQRKLNVEGDLFANWDPAVIGSSLKNLAGIVGRAQREPFDNFLNPKKWTNSAAENFSATMAKQQDTPVMLDGLQTTLREERKNSPSVLNRAQASPIYDAVGGAILAAGTDPLMYAVPEAGFTKAKVAKGLIEAGEFEKAALVMRAGKSAVTSEDLAKIGMEGAGGLKLFGRGPTIVPFDVTRVGGKATAPLRSAIGDIALDKGLYKVIGKGAEAGADAPRVAMRSGNAERAVPAFLLTRQNSVVKGATASEFGQLRNDFAQAFKDGRKGGWDYNEIVKWIETADPAAKDALAAGRSVSALEKVQQGLSRVADMVEQVHGYRPDVQDFFPRLYTGPQKARTAGARAAGAYDLLARRYKAGDKLSWGVQIPEGLDSAGVREFIQQSARDTFGTKEFYSENPLVALDAYLHGAENTVRKARTLANAVGRYGSGESGLASNLLRDTESARAARRGVIESLARFGDQQKPLLDAQSALEKMLDPARFAERAGAGAVQSAAASLSDQVAKLREFAASGVTKAEANRALRLADRLESNAGNTVRTAATSTGARQEGVKLAIEQSKAELASFADALRNGGYNAEAINGWQAKSGKLLSSMASLPEGASASREAMGEAAQLYELAANIAKQAGEQATEELRLVGVMESRSKAAWAAWTEQLAQEGKIVDLTQPLSKQQIKMLQEGLVGEWRQTMQALGQSELPSNIAVFTTDFEQKIGNLEQFFRNYYDPIINWVKARQVATPGFVLRNLQGGAFNNWIAGVRTSSYKQFLTLRTSEKALASASVEDQLIYRQVRALLGESQTLAGAEVNIPLFGAGNLRPWSPNFKPFRWLRTANEHVEADMLRGPMLWDTLKRDESLLKAIRGGDQAEIAARMQAVSEEAVARVYKYHFDYSDLSHFEQKYAKRILPFYTWTRNNIALQAEQLVAQPQKYYWYLRASKTVEKMSPAEPVVPEYWGANKMRLPIKVGGARLYYTPDLPFEAALDFAARPKEATLGSVAPVLKTPVEYWANKQVYKDIPLTNEMKQVPDAWSAIPGLMPLLATVQVPGRDAAFAKKGANGKYFMSARNQYLVEQALPEMGRARRAVASDKNSQAKALSSLASMLLGVRMRANTQAEIESELTRQKYAKKDAAAQLKRDQKSGYKR